MSQKNTVASREQSGGLTAGTVIAADTIVVVAPSPQDAKSEIQDRWITAIYGQSVQEDGHRIVGVGANEEWERAQQGWERVVVEDADGSRHHLKIADASVSGGFIVLMKLRTEPG